MSCARRCPPGMRIEPFYDRAELVNRTIATVGKNLAEGALLVVLVLFLLLGELARRAGRRGDHPALDAVRDRRS